MAGRPSSADEAVAGAKPPNVSDAVYLRLWLVEGPDRRGFEVWWALTGAGGRGRATME